MKKVYILFAIVTAGLITITSCTTSDLDPTVKQSKDAATGITKVDNLYAALKGAYSRMQSSGYWGGAIILTNEVRTDNCYSNGNSGRFTTQGGFQYSENTGYVWDNCYGVISSANLIISQDLTTLEGDMEWGNYLVGQAYAIRALAHWDLLRTYGQMHTGGNLGVPVVHTYLSGASSDEELYPARNTIDEVKSAIYSDLDMAYSLMSNEGVGGNKEFMNMYTAKALEARVATYFGEWSRAKAASEVIINSGNFSIVSEGSFISHWNGKNNSNSIFEVANNSSDNAGNLSLAFMYRTRDFITDKPIGSYGDVSALENTLDLYEDGDVRKEVLQYEVNNKGNTFLVNAYKYPDITSLANNIVLFRYEEVILNYAEALFETGGDALTQLNMITSNRGASAYTSVTKDDIMTERRKELMFEGFRFDDLLRTGSDIEKIDVNQNFASTIPYGSYLMAWPIPRAELDANSNMVPNPGY